MQAVLSLVMRYRGIVWSESCVIIFLLSSCRTKQLTASSALPKWTAMPTLSAPCDVSSLPPSPVDRSPRRMSWGKLVQRFTDFGAGVNNSSIEESSSNNGSRSDLSDSGTSNVLHVLHCSQNKCVCQTHQVQLQYSST